MTTAEIAEAVGVTDRSVRYWLNPRETHPSNRHLDRLVELAAEADGAHTFQILAAEAGEFQRLVNELRVNFTIKPNATAQVAQN